MWAEPAGSSKTAALGGLQYRWEGTYNTNVPVYCPDPFVRTLLEELRAHRLLHREDHTVLAPDSDRCAAIFHGFDRVLDLEVATVRGEDGVG